MKGIGKVDGWKVSRRGKTYIKWNQINSKRWVAILHIANLYYSMVTSDSPRRTFKGAGSLDRARAAIKKYMAKYP